MELTGPGGQIGLTTGGKEARSGNVRGAHGLWPERVASYSLPGVSWKRYAAAVRWVGQRPRARGWDDGPEVSPCQAFKFLLSKSNKIL